VTEVRWILEWYVFQVVSTLLINKPSFAVLIRKLFRRHFHHGLNQRTVINIYFVYSKILLGAAAREMHLNVESFCQWQDIKFYYVTLAAHEALKLLKQFSKWKSHLLQWEKLLNLCWCGNPEYYLQGYKDSTFTISLVKTPSLSVHTHICTLFTFFKKQHIWLWGWPECNSYMLTVPENMYERTLCTFESGIAL